MSDILKEYEWRYATKKFDASKKISDSDMFVLKEAMRMAPSSYGMQPYEMIIVENDKVRQELCEKAGMNQPQIKDASHLIVFANNTKIDEAYLTDYIDSISKVRNISKEDLKGRHQLISSAVTQQSEDWIKNWAKNQAYIGLGNLLATASRMQIDACPMEGFSTEKFDEILGLANKNLSTAVLATLGYRDHADAAKDQKKVRKSKEEFFNYIS
ncbi:MAG: NAD(P)H-dependent oxidoreductase [Flavobacteriaceae bacterium]|nr:NAD(P)H-dependent oxidoreductase [Psychroflexus sp.]